jgi:hypothetical protein
MKFLYSEAIAAQIVAHRVRRGPLKKQRNHHRGSTQSGRYRKPGSFVVANQRKRVLNWQEDTKDSSVLQAVVA